jgi:hypothetical protein
MKPFPPAQLTPEDFQILCGLWPGRPWWKSKLLPIGHSICGDRRDAEAMWKRVSAQAECWANGYDWITERRGWFPSDWGNASEWRLNP